MYWLYCNYGGAYHQQSRRWPPHLHRRCRSSVRRHSNSCFSPPTCSGCWSSPRTRHLQSQGHNKVTHYSLSNPSKGTCTSRPSPLYSIHTMMSPFWSLVVSFWYCSFQVTTCTAPECVWVRGHIFTKGFFNTLDAPHSWRTYRCDPLESGSWTGYWEQQDLWPWHHLHNKAKVNSNRARNFK